jgi:transcriptional regulator with XRE-family HTH domain
MDVIDWLLGEVNASELPKKTIAQRAGLRDASALSRILHKRVRPRHHELEAIAAVIERPLSLFYAKRSVVGVRDAREALRVLTDFVQQHDTAVVGATSAPVAVKPKRKAPSKAGRSRTVKPFHAAANPNAILLSGNDDDD